MRFYMDTSGSAVTRTSASGVRTLQLVALGPIGCLTRLIHVVLEEVTLVLEAFLVGVPLPSGVVVLSC